MYGALSPLPDWKGDGLAILHDKLGLKTLHRQWVPHALSINQKSETVLYSKLFSF
jgi:hypothetical protein